MSHLKRNASLLAAIAFVSVACSQQETPETTNAPVATVDAAQSAPVVTGLQAMTVDQLAEQRSGAPSSCSIESIDRIAFKDDAITLARKSVDLTGWFLPEKSRATGTPASIRIVNVGNTAGWEVGIGTWLPRPDVTKVMNAADPGNAGFSQALDLGVVAPGKYKVFIAFSEADAKYSCEKNREIVVE